MLKITVLLGPDAGSVLELPDRQHHMVGRLSGSVPLQDVSVSRRHARLMCEHGTWLVEDLDSANGTFVNDRPIEDPTELGQGDRIRIGRSVLQCEPAAEPATGTNAMGETSDHRLLEQILEEVRRKPDAGMDRLQSAIDRLPDKMDTESDLKPLIESLQAQLNNGIKDRLDTLLQRLSERLESVPPGPAITPETNELAEKLDRALAALEQPETDNTTGQLDELRGLLEQRGGDERALGLLGEIRQWQAREIDKLERVRRLLAGDHESAAGEFNPPGDPGPVSEEPAPVSPRQHHRRAMYDRLRRRSP